MDTSNDPRMALSLIVAGTGVAAFVLGFHPEWFGLATTAEVGFLQIMFMAAGMGFYALGSIAAMRLLWNGHKMSIMAQIGARLVGTGYVTFAAAVMADILGLGSQRWPASAHFGAVQVYGMLAGEVIMAVGVLLMYPYHLQAKGGADGEA